ncbi:MAG: methyltransferase domain-containing protein, partial [Pseudobdellovibrio sp.]
MENRITVLSEIEAVRKNPSMYVGSVDDSGKHHLLHEIIHNAIDESVQGTATQVKIRVAPDYCEVIDNGRGLPLSIHQDYKMTEAELALTKLHAGSKFKKVSNQFTAGLHGVGLSCVNALSEKMKVQILNAEGVFELDYAFGLLKSPLKKVANSSTTGTGVKFYPDREIFRNTQGFDIQKITQFVKKLSCLHPHLDFYLEDMQTGKTEVIKSKRGLTDLLAYDARKTQLLFAEAVEIHLNHNDFSFHCVFNWSTENTPSLDSFVNSVNTSFGGTHVDSFSRGLCEALSSLFKQFQESFEVEEVTDGLYAALDLRILNPHFEGQTKLRLSNPEFNSEIERATFKAAIEYFNSHSKELNAIFERLRDVRKARLNSKRVAERIFLQFGNKVINEEIYKEQFGARSKNWHDSAVWITDQKLLQHHADMFKLNEDSVALDVCCGSGVVGASFKHKVKKVVGLDLTPEMVNLAKTRLDEVHQGNVYSIPFPENSFDLVCTREVLHLLPYPEKPVSEIYRVLKPGGQFIVGQILPFSEVDAAWMYRIFKKKQPLIFNMFQEEDFRKMLLGAGFNQLEMQEINVWESIDVWINSYETTHIHRHEIREIYRNATQAVKDIHPFKILPNGEIQDLWRWCI